MDTIIMIYVGGGLIVGVFIILLQGKNPNIKNISLFLGLCAGILLFGLGVNGSSIGEPKTSITAGSYTVVGYAEVSQDKQSYYQLILEQDGEVKLYALPKDMIDTVHQIPETSEQPGTLEVIEKSGLRKATLYIPLRK